MSCHRRQYTPLAIGGRVTGVPDMGAQVSTTGAVTDIGDKHNTDRSLHRTQRYRTEDAGTAQTFTSK